MNLEYLPTNTTQPNVILFYLYSPVESIDLNEISYIFLTFFTG